MTDNADGQDYLAHLTGISIMVDDGLAGFLTRALSKGALISGIGATSIASHELIEHAGSLARDLRAASVQQAEPVLIAIETVPADLAALLAVWASGGVAVPIHANAAPSTVEAIVGQTAVRLVIRDGALATIAAESPKPRALLRDAALIIFTSGSTGAPKGVVISHSRFVAKLEALSRLLCLSPTDHVVVPLQLTFIFGLWASLLSLEAGARLTMVSRFSAERVAGALADGATVFAAVPSMLRAVVAKGSIVAPSLRLILTGGEAYNSSLSRDIATLFPHAGVYDLYGLTETGSCDFHLAPDGQAEGSGSIGIPTEGVAFRIANGDDIVSQGFVGELQILSSFEMLGYLDRPDLTSAAYAKGGFFRTGDLARQRSDGRVELVGRFKEIISRGGNKIAPLEIENAIGTHPEVAAALCAGVPDSRLGEAVHAMIILKGPSSLHEEGLRAWLATKIERFKIPDVIEFVQDFPTGATGKASRAAITARFTLPPDGQDLDSIVPHGRSHQ